MAVSFVFKESAIQGDSNTRKVSWFALDDSLHADPDEILILNAAEIQLPFFWDGMPRTGGFDIQHLLEVEGRPEQWVVSANFQRSKGIRREERRSEVGGSAEFSFELATQSQHVRTAINQTGWIKDPNNPGTIELTSQNAGPEALIGPRAPIGVTLGSDGTPTVEGVEVNVPIASFQFAFSVPLANVTQTYVNLLKSLVGRVNNKEFVGRQAGEVMLTGVSGRHRLFGDSDISFRFEERRNLTNITIGFSPDEIIVPSKRGFDYMWVYWARRIPKTLAQLAQGMSPIAVYVAQVFEYADLNLIFPLILAGTSSGQLLSTADGQQVSAA